MFQCCEAPASLCWCLSVPQAYKWCIEAMKEITVGLPVKVVVDVLRQASKVNLKSPQSFEPQTAAKGG